MILLFNPCLKGQEGCGMTCLQSQKLSELTCRGNDVCISCIPCHEKWERAHLYYHDFHGAEPETDGKERL